MSNYIQINVAVYRTDSDDKITEEDIMELCDQVIGVFVDNGYEMGGSWTLREAPSDE